MTEKLHNGWTAKEYENLKRTSPEYAHLSREEIAVLIARYGGSMFRELRAGQPTEAARQQARDAEEEAAAEAHYARMRESCRRLDEENGK